LRLAADNEQNFSSAAVVSYATRGPSRVCENRDNFKSDTYNSDRPSPHPIVPLLFAILCSIVGWVFTELVVDIPLELLAAISIPRWLLAIVGVSLLSWGLGD
jgi:hypothetical protein